MVDWVKHVVDDVATYLRSVWAQADQLARVWQWLGGVALDIFPYILWEYLKGRRRWCCCPPQKCAKGRRDIVNLLLVNRHKEKMVDAFVARGSKEPGHTLKYLVTG